MEKAYLITFLQVRWQRATGYHHCQALLDSGAESNFMDFTLAQNLRIPITPFTHPISFSALNKQELPGITYTTGPITLIKSGNHTEELSFLLT